MMFQGRHLSKKIGGQGQKNVIGRIVPANFTKFILIIYSLLKMTTESGVGDREYQQDHKNNLHRKIELHPMLQHPFRTPVRLQN